MVTNASVVIRLTLTVNMYVVDRYNFTFTNLALLYVNGVVVIRAIISIVTQFIQLIFVQTVASSPCLHRLVSLVPSLRTDKVIRDGTNQNMLLILFPFCQMEVKQGD